MEKSVSTLLVILVLTIMVFPVNASQGVWISKMATPQTDVIDAGVINGKIFSISKSSNYVYDPLNELWTEKKPMPTPRGGFGLAIHQNKIYIIGGSVNWTSQTGSIYSGIVEVYNPATDNWETKQSMPIVNSSIKAHVIQDKIHVIVEDIHYIYDIPTDSWLTDGIPMPVPDIVGSSCSTVLDNKIYFFSHNRTQIYDSQNDTWSFGTPIPSYGFYSSCCATTGFFAPKKIYIFGGFISLSETSNSTLIYDPKNGTWSVGTQMPTARHWPACAVINDEIYVIGGITSLHYKTRVNEQYTPTNYVPEFPSLTILPLLLVSSLAVVITRIRKR